MSDYAYEERAAIAEYHGELSREEVLRLHDGARLPVRDKTTTTAPMTGQIVPSGKMMSDDARVGGWAALIVAVVSLAYTAWVVKAMWAWFVVPLGVPPLSWAQAGGIDLLVGILTLSAHKAGRVVTWGQVFTVWGTMAIVLGFGLALRFGMEAGL